MSTASSPLPGIGTCQITSEPGPRAVSVQHAQPLARFVHVSKWYGPVIGVNDLDLSIGPGITGLLGPNGAGKSTFIKLLTGVVRPSLGSVWILQYRAGTAGALASLGYCPENDVLWDDLNGRAFVEYAALSRGMTRQEAREATAWALEQVGMSDRANRKLRGASKGMRQRIRLAQALVHQPQLLVLDEPLNGVDPAGRIELMQLFREYAQDGRGVLLSSHILDEIDDLAEQVIFMGHGRVLAQGDIRDIRNLLADVPVQIRVVSDASRSIAREVVGWDEVVGVTLTNDTELTIAVRQAEHFLRRFAHYVAGERMEVESLRTLDADVDATFTYVMQAARRF